MMENGEDGVGGRKGKGLEEGKKKRGKGNQFFSLLFSPNKFKSLTVGGAVVAGSDITPQIAGHVVVTTDPTMLLEQKDDT